MAGGEYATRVVLTTLPDADAAEAFVRCLVEERLVACGNIVPGIVSLYWWKGEVERASEALVILKTTEGVLRDLLTRLPELHPYEVPELLALPVGAGHLPYLAWVAQETRGGESR
ncbi:MAG: divalent-cation tolerance protein CutA [Gemmatimonadetes bacterium]|nr:divalent-cation tolerance protein CutA [Gemmatimonadota bacterium]